MRLERLTTAEHGMYNQAISLYRQSFPFHEQREAASQTELMGNEAYQFNLIYDGAVFVGLLLCWETDRFLYVEHFCISPALRNRKYGRRALELLRQRGKTVILEIDPPVDEISIRRRGFYERAGYRENPFSHVHPAYHADCSGHPLVVMSCPEPLSEELYQEFDRYLKTAVMGGEPCRQGSRELR